MLAILAVIGGCLFGVGLGGYLGDAFSYGNKHEIREDVFEMAFGLVILFGSLFLMALL